MEVVSHLLFEACRRIIAQLQTAIAEKGGKAGRVRHRRRRRDLSEVLGSADRLHVRVWQMDGETEAAAPVLMRQLLCAMIETRRLD